MQLAWSERILKRGLALSIGPELYCLSSVAPLVASLQVLLDAADTASVTSKAFVDAVRSVTEASKRAASMYRTVQSSLADGEAFVELHPDLGGHELVLAQLAALYGGPDRAGAERAYRAADRDSSGFLDFRELCGVVKVRVSHPASCCLPL